MPNYHYTKSGNLDMRYSSSKSYVASGGGRSGPSSGGGYSSSSNYGGSSSGYSSYGGGGGGTSSDLHFTKSGNLDMRYASSKAHVASGASVSGTISSGRSSASPSSSDLHFTKSGTLDMRYASSKAYVDGCGSSSGRSSSGRSTSTPSASPSDLHYTKSGALDMRFRSSKALMDGMMEKLKITEEPDHESSYRSSTPRHRAIPSHIPTTNKGLPDMRFKEAKEWVARESCNFNGALPSWMPRTKDGNLDAHKNVVKAFFDPSKGLKIDPNIPTYNPQARRNYYERRCMDPDYYRTIQETRRKNVAEQYIPIPMDTTQLLSLRQQSQSMSAASLSLSIQTINYDDVKNYCIESNQLGTGGFGVVYRGTFAGKTVAIKKLHMEKMNKSLKTQFVKEVTIMSLFTDHSNLVKMYGYALEPCVIVMEYVGLGSLSWLIHHCEDAKVEANISDGRIKKKLAAGIVSGMIQLHAADIIHRDLKPQNVLVNENYTPKIADFGFSSFRGRTTSMIGTTAFGAEDDILAGTAAYMAPELIDGDVKVTHEVDVYAFGVVLNEILHEEEPYAEAFADLHARGPFGAALLAKSGRRPAIKKDLVPVNVRSLIEACWNADPKKRPSFVQIAQKLNEAEMKFLDYKFQSS